MFEGVHAICLCLVDKDVQKDMCSLLLIALQSSHQVNCSELLFLWLCQGSMPNAPCIVSLWNWNLTYSMTLQMSPLTHVYCGASGTLTVTLHRHSAAGIGYVTGCADSSSSSPVCDQTLKNDMFYSFSSRTLWRLCYYRVAVWQHDYSRHGSLEYWVGLSDPVL